MCIYWYLSCLGLSAVFKSIKNFVNKFWPFFLHLFCMPFSFFLEPQLHCMLDLSILSHWSLCLALWPIFAPLFFRLDNFYLFMFELTDPSVICSLLVSPSFSPLCNSFDFYVKFVPLNCIVCDLTMNGIIPISISSWLCIKYRKAVGFCMQPCALGNTED